MSIGLSRRVATALVIRGSEAMTTVREIAMEFLNRGGKRLRPRLCQAVYDHFAGQTPPNPSVNFQNLLTAIECFHKASLIHDDIQDGDEERYGRPTVWKEHGVPLAIAVGDWLVAYGYRLISESGYPNVTEMLTATVKSHQRLCEGQGDELAGSKDYVSICERKTGEAFVLAATLGALAAGTDPAPCREWGLVYGVLFQIRDDIADSGETPELVALQADYKDRLDKMAFSRQNLTCFLMA